MNQMGNIVMVASTHTTPRTTAGTIPALKIVFKLYPPAVMARGTTPVAIGVTREDMDAMLHMMMGPMGFTPMVTQVMIARG